MRFPFDEAPDTAVITCCHVLDGHAIRHVSHDADDGMWQFLCGKAHDTEEAHVVSLREIYTRDRSIAALAKLPCGSSASRKWRFTRWSISKQ